MCCCSYGTFARERVDIGLGKSELGQQIAGVGTERWRRRCRLRIGARQAKTRSHDAHRTIDVRHGFEGLEQSSLENLRMLEYGRHVEDFPGGDAVLVEERLRSSRPEKRGSAMSSSRPINRHSVSNCSCLFAAMFNSPSPVWNVPEGLAVMFSFPMGCGFTPATSQFETAQPMATSEASSIDTSMNSPSLVRPRRTRAAAMAKAAVMPPMVSATG